MKRQLLCLATLLGLWGVFALGGGDGMASAAEAQWTTAEGVDHDVAAAPCAPR